MVRPQVQYRVLPPPTVATQTMQVTLPDGSQEGLMMQVMTPAGWCQTIVPPGLGPGQSFAVSYMVRLPPSAAAAPPPMAEAVVADAPPAKPEGTKVG